MSKTPVRDTKGEKRDSKKAVGELRQQQGNRMPMTMKKMKRNKKGWSVRLTNCLAN